MYDKTRKPRPNARGPRLPTMHPFTIVFTQRWASDDLVKHWPQRHAEPGEPDWSARLAQVQFQIEGSLGILREVKRNKQWWDKPKRTEREKAIARAVPDLGQYLRLTGVRYNGQLGFQPMDDMAFRALQQKTPEALEAMRIFEGLCRE